MTTSTPTLDLPPGPRLPAAAQLWQWTFRPLPFLEQAAARYGDPFTMRLAGFGSLIMLSSPDAIKEVFRGDPLALHSGEANEFFAETVGPNSVLVLDEARHARQRRVLLPPFKGERMRAFTDVMRTATEDSMVEWPRGTPFRLDRPMRDITLRVILQAVLGLQPGAEMDTLAAKMRSVLNFGANTFSLMMLAVVPRRMFQGSRWLPVYRQVRVLDDALKEFLRQRRAAGQSDDHPNVLTDLLEARHEDGQPLTDQELRDDIVTLLAAGHDTTSVALSWAFERLLEYPLVVSRIVAEVREVTGGQALQAEHLPQLTYLEAAIKESLRQRTVVPFVVRLLKKPFTAGGREYPPGVQLAPCMHLVHRREDIYPQPQIFRPERFLERKYTPQEWFPFGGGGRLCIGMPFALHEMKVLLATVLPQLQLERPPGSVSRIARRGVLLAPSDGCRVIARDMR